MVHCTSLLYLVPPDERDARDFLRTCCSWSSWLPKTLSSGRFNTHHPKMSISAPRVEHCAEETILT